MRTIALKIGRVVLDILILIIRYLPGNIGVLLRRFYYKIRFKHCGKNLIVGVGVIIDGAALISVGDNVVIDSYCIIATSRDYVGDVRIKRNVHDVLEFGNIVIEDNVHIVQFCIIMGHGGVLIRSFSTLSANCKIYSMTNLAYDPKDRSKVTSIMPYSQAIFLISQVILEENVWLGLNTIVMPGVKISTNSFSVANSVIIDSFEENSYIQGNPSVKAKKRFEV